MCRTYSSHTCCSGKCKAITMKADCFRLLKLSGSPAMDDGVNLNRQCQSLGICEPFVPGPGPPLLTTPWDVHADDLAVKYRDRTEITFEVDAVLRKDVFIARKPGQTYDQIPADSMKPGGIRDAGVIVFTDDSKVHPEFGAVYTEGMATYCVAPILRNGVGGGYYAVGIGCCGTKEKFKFECDDSLSDTIKSGLVIGAGTEKYVAAQQVIEGQFGWKFHDKTKGIMTPQPFFVRIMKDYAQEALQPHAGYVYVPSSTITHCAAAIMDSKNPKQTDIEFWAAGVDCCDMKTGFHCGDADKPGGRSGVSIIDRTGEFGLTLQMAKLRFGVKAPNLPMYVDWKVGVLVNPPR